MQLWLAEAIWVGERRQYLIAAADEAGAMRQMRMITHVKETMDAG